MVTSLEDTRMLRGDRLEYGVWKSSTDTFIFSLKDHAGVGPVKMPVKSDQTDHAVQHNSSYCSIFGGGNELCVESNANSNTSSHCRFGNTYYISFQAMPVIPTPS